MRDAHVMNGGKLIGALDPKAYGRMQDFMFEEKLIKQKLPPQSLLIDKPGFVEAINRFDHARIEADAKACKGL
jgi:NitT/TauT family transport system substrate-binding protein